VFFRRFLKAFISKLAFCLHDEIFEFPGSPEPSGWPESLEDQAGDEG
jgi:hypothetical protein